LQVNSEAHRLSAKQKVGVGSADKNRGDQVKVIVALKIKDLFLRRPWRERSESLDEKVEKKRPRETERHMKASVKQCERGRHEPQGG
jgi:hypothetical protein